MMLKLKIGALRLVMLPFVMGAGFFMIPLMWLEEVQKKLEAARTEQEAIERNLKRMDSQAA